MADRHESLDRLLQYLELERIDRDLYRAAPTPARGGQSRLFGGQVAAQALRAATLTVDEDHLTHSLHGYFLRPGQPDMPLLLHVERIRNGRSFTTRRVTVRQEGEAIFNMSASFHQVEDGHTYIAPMPAGIPHPDDESYDWPPQPFAEFLDHMPFEMLDLGPATPDDEGHLTHTKRTWARARGPIPDDPALHQCLMTFMSDMGAVFAAALAVVENPMSLMGASLDHAVWFHRPLRVDDWFLYDLVPLTATGARGLVRGSMYTADGTHAASVAQEALIRPLRGS